MATLDLKTKEDIRTAAASAVEVIARAAADAGRVVSDAAAVAVGVLNTKGAGDHDLLIELKTKMEGLKDDIRDIKNGTSARIAEHETRLCSLEASKSKQSLFITLGISIVLILTSLLVYHLFGIKI